MQMSATAPIITIGMLLIIIVKLHAKPFTSEEGVRIQRTSAHFRPTWLDFSCSKRLDGYYADMIRGCHLYYQCVNHVKVDDFICPLNTLFQQAQQLCDYESNVNCSESDLFYPKQNEPFITHNYTQYDNQIASIPNGLSQINVTDSHNFINSTDGKPTNNINDIYHMPFSNLESLSLINHQSSINSKNKTYYDNRSDIMPFDQEFFNSNNYTSSNKTFGNYTQYNIPFISNKNWTSESYNESIPLITAWNYDQNRTNNENVSPQNVDRDNNTIITIEKMFQSTHSPDTPNFKMYEMEKMSNEPDIIINVRQKVKGIPNEIVTQDEMNEILNSNTKENSSLNMFEIHMQSHPLEVSD